MDASKYDTNESWVSQMRVKEITEARQLNEFFSESYDAFGWFDNKGEVIYPTRKDAEDHGDKDDLVIHSTLAMRHGISYSGKAFKEGWVRWYLAGKTLNMSCFWNAKNTDTKQVIERGIRTLVSKYFNDPAHFNYFRSKVSQNSDYLYIADYVLHCDIRDSVGNSYRNETFSSNSLSQIFKDVTLYVNRQANDYVIR